MSISTLILTLNEEINLPISLASLKWCDDIVVLDSFSSDSTETVAREMGARFVQRKFDDYAAQRNFGLNEIEYKHQWVLMVDADEVVTSELAIEINDVSKNNISDETCLYRMRRKDHFMGRWIRHSSGYPVWFGRLARTGRVRVERSINEGYYTDGQIGYLRNHLLHFPFNKGFHSWIEKHNRYSEMEAMLMMASKTRKFQCKNFFNPDPTVRRKAVKDLIYSMPGRPLLVFLGFYFLKLGFLDGKAGLTYCILRSFYEYMIDCKVRELKLRQKGLTV